MWAALYCEYRVSEKGQHQILDDDDDDDDDDNDDNRWK